MKTKFTIAEIFLISLITASLFAQDFNYISDFDSQGVPLDMVNTSVSQSLLNNIDASFPEGYPVPDYNPDYISETTETNVIINELADVWVTFIGEGAGYRNVLGYYTYDVFDPPQSPPSDQDITIIFPNVSAAGSGGGLITGDKMYLGQFTANTAIGWVLIANGWNGNQVTYGNWMLYSDSDFNPESSTELQKHNVNLYDDNELVVVFGFEDIRRDYGSCDQDFNDALFLVTANPYNAIETSSYNPISTDGGGQSSGNDGGLESHRGISSSIAQRTFDRSSQPSTSPQSKSTARSGGLLADLVPISLREGDLRTISSPTDLESITKANKVWSADYDLDQQRFATVFATETNDEVYDHTKVVCDRLAGSKIMSIKEIEIDSQKFLLTSLRKKNGSIEYAISFSITTTQDFWYKVFSKWAVDQYEETGNFLNYQVWSSAPYLSIAITKQILSNLADTHQRIGAPNQTSYLPTVYVSSGKFVDNAIELQLVNKTNATTTVNIVGSMTETEVDTDLELLLKTITLPPGEHTYLIQNPDNTLFDLELKLSVYGEEGYDVAYFSDGAWGLDYSKQNTSISNLEITSNNTLPSDDEYHISRNISVDLQSDDYISIYRHLMPSGGTVDLQQYNTIEFEGTFTKPTTLRIIKDEIEDWNDQFSFVINPKSESDTYVVPFSYLTDKQGNSLQAGDVKMIVFTQDSRAGIDHEIQIKNVTFSTRELKNYQINNALTVYPNPSNGEVNLSLFSSSQDLSTLRIYSIHGVLVHQNSILINKGFNNITTQLPEVPSGTYTIQIEYQQGGLSHQSSLVLIKN